MAKLKLQYLHIVTPPGVGGFGRVIFVQENNNNSETYALKILSKQQIVVIGQQEHVLNENNNMAELRSDLIVRLQKAFKEDEYLYLFIEPCLRGELCTLLYEDILLPFFPMNNPVKRLYAQESPKHGWFNVFHWELLRNKTMEPRFIPTVKSSVDTRNFDFDGFPEEADYPRTDDVTSWYPRF